MNEQCLVSVIIPTYKRPVEFLSRAIQSVTEQSYNNLEIIVIDDSPETYGERQRISDYVNSISDDRVHYYQNSCNLGGALSRNRGIELSTGKYITFLDDDDEYLPNKISNQVTFMEEHGCDLSFSNMRMYNNSGKVVDFRAYRDIWSFENEELLKYHLMHHLTGTPTFMFKACKLKEIKGFDDAKMGQEFYLMMKSIQSGLNIRYLDSCDVKIYKHGGEAITNGRNKITGENRLYEYKKSLFDRVNPKQKRYIRFRHWAVMVVAYKRNKMYLKMLGATVVAFVSSPIDLVKEIFKYIKKI